MAYAMYVRENGRRGRAIGGIVSHAVATAVMLLSLGLICFGLTSCVSGTDDDLVGADSVTRSNPNAGRSAFGLPTGGGDSVDALAFSAPSGLVPATAPSGAPYRSCSIDYRHIDWDAEPAAIVESHAAASAVPCVAEDWYKETAFQNGILTFMVLVGEQTLAAAAPTSDDPAAMVVSLRSQGFDRLAAVDIAGSGRCEDGEVQAALFTLDQPAPPMEGLEPLLDSAAASGATIDQGEAITLISGGGATCATAIIHSDGFAGWVTSSDTARLKQAVRELQLPAINPG